MRNQGIMPTGAAVARDAARLVGFSMNCVLTFVDVPSADPIDAPATDELSGAVAGPSQFSRRLQ